jgi:thiosulfate dehydrogenase (quinone) large subunit
MILFRSVCKILENYSSEAYLIHHSNQRKVNMARLQEFFCLFLRLTLAIILLSAAAGSFGFWGSSGASNSSLGNFASSIGRFNLFSSQWLPIVGWVITGLELLLGIMLVLGIYHRFAGFATGFLLLFFGITLTAIYGFKISLESSVFVASAAAFLLATVGPGWLAFDN